MTAAAATATAVRLEPALASIAHVLLSQPESPYAVHVYDDPRGGIVSWMVVERDGCLATVSYDPISAYTVGFPIRPSRELGSSLLVHKPGWRTTPFHGAYLPDDGNPSTVSGVLELVELAARPEYASDFGVFPNHGWASLSWCMDKMLRWHDDGGLPIA